MDHAKIKKYAVGLLSKHLTFNDVPKEYIPDVEETLKLVKSHAEDDDAVKSIAGQPDQAFMQTEVIKYDKNGQWKFEKVAKPGPTLSYTEMNKPKMTENPTTIDYSSGAPKVRGYQWKTSDTTNRKAKTKQQTSRKMSERNDRIRDAIRSGRVIDDREKS